MINKRLIQEMKESLAYVIQSVQVQWLMLVFNIIAMLLVSKLLEGIFLSTFKIQKILIDTGILFVILMIRFFLAKKQVILGYEASKHVKTTLREKVFRKLDEIGSGYPQYVSSSSLVQMCIEGIDQLEIYFSGYLSAFFYSMIAPITLFIVLIFISWKAAVVLLICVPLIPITIILISKFAKKMLSKYWGEYLTLGDSFLENLEGLTTLKIYEADAYRHQKMNEEAEKFRKITMKVLTMQLNSITVMDIVAFGGAALGMIIALLEFQNGTISIAGALAIFLLSADFFIPMRSLGSLFHIAMNGVAASDRLFAFLDLEIPQDMNNTPFINGEIKIRDCSFEYEEYHPILKNINLTLKPNQFIGIVGKSGCGKSTLVSVLMKQHTCQSGEILLNDTPISTISRSEWMKHVTCLSSNAKIFKGTVKDNLLMGNPNASEKAMWEVLKTVHLDSLFQKQDGLETKLKENGSNLSGGECQRLAFARALLHDSEIYIFDEATSNIDIDSENDLMKLIESLSKHKTVIMITHRLANTKHSDQLIVMHQGQVCGVGTHEILLKTNPTYQDLYESQMKLERGEADEEY